MKETTDICAHVLYWSHLSLPSISEVVFVEFIEFATESEKFSSNSTMYKQTVGIAVGSHLGPTLVNIFVGFHELLAHIVNPLCYYRYTNDTFCEFESEDGSLVT